MGERRTAGVEVRRIPGVRWSRFLLRAPQLKEVRRLAREGDWERLTRYVERVVDRGPDWQFRRAVAAYALGELHAAEAVPSLARALREDEPPLLRATAAQALRRIGGTDAVAALVGVMNDRPFLIRKAAIEAIGDSGNPALVEDVAAALQGSAHWTLKLSATEALGMLPSAEAVHVLDNQAANASRGLAQDAVYWLGRSPDQSAEDVLLRLRAEAPRRSVRWRAWLELRRRKRRASRS